MNASFSVCGLTCLAIPARRVTRRTTRAAPCRSSRRPSTVTKQRAFRALAGGQVNGPRGPRDGDDLAALTGDHQGAMAAFRAQVLDVRIGRL